MPTRKYQLLIFITGLLWLCACNGVSTKETAPMSTDTIASIENTDNSRPADSIVTDNNPDIHKKSTVKKPTETSVPTSGPKQSSSRFGKYHNFSGQKVYLDEGKKVVCFFAPGCEHCIATAKEIDSISDIAYLPPIYIFFINEEVDKIPDFFKESNSNFPYTIVDIPVFWDLIGMSADTPGVAVLWNGNIIKFFEGSETNTFNTTEFRTVCEKE